MPPVSQRWITEMSRLAAAVCARNRSTSPQLRNPKTLSDPTRMNERRSKFSIYASVVEQKFFGIEERPQRVFKSRAAGGHTVRAYGLERDRQFPVIGFPHHGGPEQTPDNLLVS